MVVISIKVLIVGLIRSDLDPGTCGQLIFWQNYKNMSIEKEWSFQHIVGTNKYSYVLLLIIIVIVNLILYIENNWKWIIDFSIELYVF